MNRQDDRLDSWREIADYLKREVRTVSRWEQDRGLPVHRVPGGKRGAVYAYRSEVDAWLKSSAKTPPVDSESGRPSLWWKTAIGLASACILAFALLLAFRFSQHPNPQRVKVVGAELTALDGSGNAIWRYQFPKPLKGFDGEQEPTQFVSQVHIQDLNGDGKNEILVAASYGFQYQSSDELYAFASNGRLLWRYQPNATFNFVGRKASGPWKFRALVIVPVDGKSEVWASFSDPVFAPAIVSSVDWNGHSAIRYVSSGSVLALFGVHNERGTFVLAGGVNNEYRAASYAILNVGQPSATSPQSQGNSFQCKDCPSGHPSRFVTVPQTEASIGFGQPYNIVNTFQTRQTGILLMVIEAPEPGATSYYELSDELLPKNVTVSSDYRQAHERMEKRGLIDHKWANCQEQKKPVAARVWDEAHGWTSLPVPWVN